MFLKQDNVLVNLQFGFIIYVGYIYAQHHNVLKKWTKKMNRTLLLGKRVICSGIEKFQPIDF